MDSFNNNNNNNNNNKRGLLVDTFASGPSNKVRRLEVTHDYSDINSYYVEVCGVLIKVKPVLSPTSLEIASHLLKLQRKRESSEKLQTQLASFHSRMKKKKKMPLNTFFVNGRAILNNYSTDQLEKLLKADHLVMGLDCSLSLPVHYTFLIGEPSLFEYVQKITYIYQGTLCFSAIAGDVRSIQKQYDYLIDNNHQVNLDSLSKLAKKWGHVKESKEIRNIGGDLPKLPFPSLKNICVAVVSDHLNKQIIKSKIEQESNQIISEKIKRFLPYLKKLPPTLIEDIFVRLANHCPQHGFEILNYFHTLSDFAHIISPYLLIKSSIVWESFWKEICIDYPFSKDSPTLLNIYGKNISPRGFIYDSFITQAEDDFERGFGDGRFFVHDRSKDVGQYSIANPAQFNIQFQAFTDGIFNFINWKNMLVVGSSVLASILPLPSYIDTSSYNEICNYYDEVSPFKNAEIEIYLYGFTNAAQQNRKLFEIRKIIEDSEEEFPLTISVTDTSVTFSVLYPTRHIKVIMGKFSDPYHVLCNIDIDCCAVAFDGKNVLCLPRFRNAVNRKWNIVNPSPYFRRVDPLTMEQKLLKYANYGFSIIAPLYRQENEWKKERDIQQLEAGNVYLTDTLRGLELIIMAQKSQIIRQKNNTECEEMQLPYGRDWKDEDSFVEEVRKREYMSHGLHDHDELFPSIPRDEEDWETLLKIYKDFSNIDQPTIKKPLIKRDFYACIKKKNEIVW